MDIGSPPHHNHRDAGRENRNSPGPAASSNNMQYDSEADHGRSDNERSKNSSPPDQSTGRDQNSSNMPAPPTAAAAAIHQPKIVQTAFIHKLYNMLEDPNIQHLISWSATADSFVMSPSPDFSKVLSQYFKHTNISSFVRQLNMYGFHKERDVFHTGSPESTLWEFKHGGGNFKRGDLVGLREIKRRASRHALVHRENNYQKPVPSQPGTPAEPVHMPPETTDSRLSSLEHSLYDMSARLQRSEEAVYQLQFKNQSAMEAMNRMLSFSQDMSRFLLAIIHTDSPVHRDVITLQAEMHRQADVLRAMDEPPPEPPMSSRQQYFGNIENPPVSPRQMAQDDGRRNLTVPGRHNLYKPTVPSNLSAGTRRAFGSISGASPGQASPSRHAPQAAPPPHPLSNVEPPPSSALGRRHTAADIRAHGWNPGLTPPAFPSSHALSSSAWPPSPNRPPPEDQRLRESLSAYSLNNATRTHPNSRPTTPPPPPFSNGNSNGGDTFGNWSWSSASNRAVGGLRDSSAPPTRRGSMAHILNPTDTAERSDEDEDPRGEEDRKRKRLG